MDTIETIKAYQPFNEQEEKDKELILSFLENYPDAYLRSNCLGHMTASCWITNKTFDKVLLCYHKLYQSWAWLGGHADGQQNLLEVAIKEAKEESGLKTVVPYDKKILSLESLTVNGHVKKGKYVSSHLHFNVTYLLIADENEPLFIKEDENSGVKWFSLSDALKASNEEWFIKNIYSKLNYKLLQIKEKENHSSHE